MLSVVPGEFYDSNFGIDCKRLQDFQGAIPASVIHQNEFPRPFHPGHDGSDPVDQQWKVFLLVEHGNDQRDHCGPAPLLSICNHFQSPREPFRIVFTDEHT